MPPDVLWTDLRDDRVLGFRLAMIDRTRSEDQPDYVPVEADALSGEIRWEREDIMETVGRDCFDGRVGILNPEGGFVTTACGHEMVFLDHWDATTATVVAAPNYFEAFPNARDVEAYVDGITRIGGDRVSLTRAQREAYAAEYRTKPHQWFLGGPLSLNLDGENRVWAANTRNRDVVSHLDVWMDRRYAGTVRIRSRLVDYDILGSTLVALVERQPNEYGIAQRAIDWYDIGELEFARDE